MTAPVAISGIDDPDQIRIRLLASGRDVHAPLAALDAFYQPLDADLTSWAAITRAAGFDAFVATPSSANLRTLLTDETGTGATVFANAPTITGIPVFSGIPSLTGGALSFPASQVASAGANDLDDYEEGNWTPRIDGTGSAGAGTYTTQIGRYTKIGRKVLFSLQLVWTAHTGTGDMNIEGLPFTIGAQGCATVIWGTGSVALTFVGVVPGALLASGGTQIGLRGLPTTGNTIATMAIDTAASFICSGFYSV